jgi:hypothetical protein
VYTTDHASTFLISDRIGRNNSAYKGAIRVYMPDVDFDNPENTKTSLFFVDRTPPNVRFEDFLVRRLYDFSLRKKLNANRLPNFADIKSAILSLEEKELLSAEKAKLKEYKSESEPIVREDTAELKQLHQKLALQQKLIDTLREENDLAVSLAAETETQLSEIEAERDIISKERDELLERVSKIDLAVEQKKSKLPNPTKLIGIYPPFSLLEDWSREQFGGSLVIAARALREANNPKYNVYRKPENIYQALLCLGQAAKLRCLDGADIGAKESYERELRRFGFDDGISLAEERASLYGSEYYVKEGKHQYFLGRHIKKGNSHKPEGCLRIYYATDNGTTIVGSMPRHLTNTMS